jgi:hypothetical protein
MNLYVLKNRVRPIDVGQQADQLFLQGQVFCSREKKKIIFPLIIFAIYFTNKNHPKKGGGRYYKK